MVNLPLGRVASQLAKLLTYLSAPCVDPLPGAGSMADAVLHLHKCSPADVCAQRVRGIKALGGCSQHGGSLSPAHPVLSPLDCCGSCTWGAQLQQ